MGGNNTVGKSTDKPVLLNDLFGPDKKSYLVRKLEGNNEELQQQLSFKRNSAGMGTSVERTATSAKPMSAEAPRKSSWSSPDDEVVYENEHVRKYRNPKTGKTYYEPKVKDLSPKERQAWLNAIKKATNGFWAEANAELKKVTDAEARREYEANREKYDHVDEGDQVQDPIEKARRAIAARRALERHKVSK